MNARAFLDLARSRRSVREYLDKPIARADLDRCLEAACLAPSAENQQPWRFTVVETADLRARCVEAATGGIYRPTRFIAGAPVLLAVSARRDLLTNRLGAALQGTQFWLFDVGLACQHFVLQAAELGIGSCYIGWFNYRKVARLLDLPWGEKLVCLVALGYPARGTTTPHRRRALEETVRYR